MTDPLLAKVRKVLAALPDITEGTHAGAIAFKANGRMFATYRANKHELVFALEPDHMDLLLASDPRFTRNPRAPAIVVDATAITDWAQMKDFLHESYKLVAKPAVKKPRKKR